MASKKSRLVRGGTRLFKLQQKNILIFRFHSTWDEMDRSISQEIGEAKQSRTW